MKTYFSNIIPRIQQYSEKLDNLTLLTDQHWVVLDELNQSKTVYIFRTNGDLLISTDGKVNKAKWEYLGQNALLIDLKSGESYLFKHGFFDQNIFALKVDGKEEYAFLINESKYNGELNNIEAVTTFLNSAYVTNPPILNNGSLNSANEGISLKFIKNGTTWKMGDHKEFSVYKGSVNVITVYQQSSNGRYFYYTDKEIFVFPNEEKLIKHLNQKFIF
jgi:hypothetical protein